VQRETQTLRAAYNMQAGPSSISVPNLKRIALFVQKLLGVVIYSMRRRVPSSISVPIPKFKLIALFVQKLLRRSRNLEIRSRDPGHAHLGLDLWSLRREVPSSSSMSVPNLKRIALFVQKLLGGPKFRVAADPLPQGAGRPNFNRLETVTTFTYKPSLVRINARNQSINQSVSLIATLRPESRIENDMQLKQ